MGCRKFLSALALLGAVMTSCGNDDAPKTNGGQENDDEQIEFVESDPLQRTPALETAVAGQYAVGTEVLGYMLADNAGNNALFSPFSFQMAASMVVNGVSPEVAGDLIRFLGTADLEALNSANRELTSVVTTLDSKVRLESANALWIDTDLPVKQDFVKVLEGDYAAALNTVEYSTDDVTAIINSWVKERTHGMIDPLFDPSASVAGPVTVVNTIYMKAPWTLNFDKEDTYNGVFHCADGDVQTDYLHAPVMGANYFSADNGRSLQLKFGPKGRYAITFILPEPTADITTWMTTLTAQDVMKFVKEGTFTGMEIMVPKFDIDAALDMRDMLKKSGLSALFEPSLWTGLTSAARPLQIGTVIQKVKFGIDETGGEGAAATGIGIIEASGDGAAPEREVFKADRPFLFVVTETGCDTPLFMGVVEHP